MSAISISNAVDLSQYKQREAMYMEIVNKYSKDELNEFPLMFALLVDALEGYAQEQRPTDVLGEIYHELELHNKYKGQFFTPQHLCTFIGKAALGAPDEIIERDGYLSLCEPCSGSGAMVLGMAQAMAEAKYNYCTQMVVTATDIDLKCVCMTYIQLSLYGIPAVVVHGNALTVEEWSHWYTPVYIVGGWKWRQKRRTANEQTDDLQAKPLENPMPEFDLTIRENGQMALF